MPKPQGTYLRVQAGSKIAANAKDAKNTVARSKIDTEARFYAALDKTAESKLKAWYRTMQALVTAIKKNEALSREDKIRKAVSEVLGEVKEILNVAKDLKTIEASLKQPAALVIRAPATLGTAGVELALAIAIVQVLAVLVRLRGRRSAH